MGLHNQSAFKRVLMLTGSSATTASSLLNAYGGQGFAMLFSGTEPSISIKDDTTPSNNWESADGPANSVQNFFKNRSFTSYTGPVTSGKRLMQADGYIKPCRHNLIKMSNKFYSASWSPTNTGVTANATTDSDGGSTASKLTETAVTDTFRISSTFTIVSGVPYTFSIKVKASERSWVLLRTNFGSTIDSYFNCSTGAQGTIGSGHTAHTPVNLGNGWWQFAVTATSSSTTAFTNVGPANADAAGAYAGTNGSGVYVYQAMCNSGSSVLDYVSSEAHNLCLQSQTFASASWNELRVATISEGTTVAPDGTATADTITSTAVTNSQLVYQSALTLTSDLTYCASFYVKKGTHRYIAVALPYSGGSNDFISAVFDLDGGGSSATQTAVGSSSGTISGTAQTALADGWYRLSISGSINQTSVVPWVGFAQAATGNTMTTAGQVTNFVGTGAETFYVWGAQVELSSAPGKYVATTAAAVYNQHFDLPVEFNSDGTVKALTREEQRTNIITYSDFSSFWLTQLLTKTNGQTDAGGTSIGALLECTASEVASVFQNFTVSAATAYTVSYYAKMVSGTGYARCLMYNATDGQIDGSDIAINATTWTRVTATFTPTVTSTNFYLSNGSDAAARDFYICFPQIEAGSTASSVIICGSAAVTRAVDDIYVATTVFPHSATEWTVYQKMTQDYLVSFAAPYSLSNETTAERHDTYLSAAGAVVARTTDGGADQASITPSGTISAATAFKFASAVKVNDFAACLNGGTVGTDVSGTVPTVYRFRLGGGQSNGSPMHGGVHESMYVPTRLADATLQTLTTP